MKTLSPALSSVLSRVPTPVNAADAPVAEVAVPVNLISLGFTSAVNEAEPGVELSPNALASLAKSLPSFI